jgi:hypothetical protein
VYVMCLNFVAQGGIIVALWRLRETDLASQVFERTDRRLRVVDVCGRGVPLLPGPQPSPSCLHFHFFSPVTS